MATDWWPARVAQHIVSIGHVLVGGAALVFAGVLIAAGSAPNAELGGVLLPLGLLLALAATAFTFTAVKSLRRAPEDRGRLSVVLSIVELLAGAAMAAGLANAHSGGPATYPGPPPGAFGSIDVFRDPLLLPAALLLALGLAGLGLEVMSRRSAITAKQ